MVTKIRLSGCDVTHFRMEREEERKTDVTPKLRLRDLISREKLKTAIRFKLEKRKLEKELFEFLSSDEKIDSDAISSIKSYIEKIFYNYNNDLKKIRLIFEFYKRILPILKPFGLRIYDYYTKMLFWDLLCGIQYVKNPQIFDSFFEELPKFLEQTQILKKMHISDLLSMFDYLNFDLNLLKDNKHYFRIRNILEKPFGLQELKLFVEKRKRRENIEATFIGKPGLSDKTTIIRMGNIIYRNFDPKQYAAWRLLLEKGLPVEEITGIASVDEAKEVGFETDKYPNQVYVKSKVVNGQTLNDFLFKRELDVKKNPKEKLTLDREKRIIRKQMDNILEKIWLLGFTHGHPHVYNFMIKYINGYPKVVLIDFNLIGPMTVESLHKETEEYAKCNVISETSRLGDFNTIVTRFESRFQQNVENWNHFILK